MSRGGRGGRVGGRLRFLRAIDWCSAMFVSASGAEGAIAGQVITASVVDDAIRSIVRVLTFISKSTNSIGKISAEDVSIPMAGCSLSHDQFAVTNNMKYFN